MGQKPASPLWLHDVAAALGLLTRLPVQVDTDLAMQRSAASSWAYPVVGFLLGGLSLLVFVIGYLIGLPPVITVILIVASQLILTGAMHEDGLADSADGLWGGWTIERRLEIMKDSHIGVYGVCAIGIVLVLRAATLLALAFSPLMILGLVAAAGLSRAVMVALMHYLPNARGGGLSKSVGRPSARTTWIAVGIAGLGSLVLAIIVGAFFAGVLLVVTAGITALACAMIARRKIKGQTGDILGATQQISEIACLIVLSALVY